MTNCITLTIFHTPVCLQNPNRGGKGWRDCCRKIEGEGSYLGERVQDGTELPRSPTANLVLVLQFPPGSGAIRKNGRHC